MIASQTGQIPNLTIDQTYNYLFNQAPLPDCLSEFGSPPEVSKTALSKIDENNDIFHSDFFDGILTGLSDVLPKNTP
ncbi:hypothetical protein PULV_a3906 [Pseudoalteromonas ulvae UL12]|nr:hypothetical protein [Pseudoalteromonas ulvae UL12]